MASALSVLASLPFYAMWVVAFVLAVSRWNKHPTVSSLVVTAGALQVIASLERFIVPMGVQRFGLADRDAMTLAFAGLGLVSTAGGACLIAAVFSERATRADPPIR